MSSIMVWRPWHDGGSSCTRLRTPRAMNASSVSPMRVPAFLLRFRTASSICTSRPRNKARESAWPPLFGWFNFTVVQSTLSASRGEAQLSGCVFRGWRITRVRPSHPQRPARDFAIVVLLTGGLVCFGSACHSRKVASPAPSIPAPAAQAQPAPAPPSPSSEAAPARRPARAATQPPPAAAPEPAPPQLKLGDALTADQQRQLNAAIDQSLSRAEASLKSISFRQLAADQKGVDQVRNFIRQAQDLRKSDLTAARSLAQRAEVLARDLAGRLR